MNPLNMRICLTLLWKLTLLSTSTLGKHCLVLSLPGHPILQVPDSIPVSEFLTINRILHAKPAMEKELSNTMEKSQLLSLGPVL